MRRIEELAERQGIALLDKGIDGQTVVQQLGALGIPVGRDAIYNIRSGRKSGKNLRRNLEMAEIRRSNVRRKDEFYLALAESGVQARQTNKKAHYSPQNLAKEIAREMGITSADVNRCLRVMRAELVLSESDGADPSVHGTFSDAASDYLRSYGKGYSSSKAVREIDQTWKGGTIEDFYRACNLFIAQPYTLRTWMPYEIDALQEFYRKRRFMFSPLSPLDDLTIEKNITGSPRMKPFVEAISLQTGLPYDEVIHSTHTNVLMYGQPSPVSHEELSAPAVQMHDGLVSLL